jgi:hypothetical protein
MWCGKGSQCKHALLVSDSFDGHITERVKAEVNEVSNLVVIPGGMTKLRMLSLINSVSACYVQYSF